MFRLFSTRAETIATLALVALSTWATTSAVQAAPSTKPGDLPASQAGQWDGPYDWPVVAIHAFLLPTGKVLHFSFPGGLANPNAFVWNPATWEFTAVPVNRPLFCSGHSFMADGRLVVTGGNGPAPPNEFRGIRDTHIFDSFDESWTRVADMADGRWYPTNVTLPDGRVLVFSGLDEQTGDINTDVEVYEPGAGTCWQVVSEAYLPLFPWMHVLSSGDVFYSGPSWETGILSTDTWSWYGIVPSNEGWRGGGMSVLLPQTRDTVMIIGGQREAGVTATAEIIELGEPSPAWRYTQSMNFPRMHANAVILPDGKILVLGGHSEMHDEDGDGPPPSSVFEAELFDPPTETWTLMAPMQVPRVYHSTALLLPDGRVLASGSTGIGPPGHTTEIYSPPYLFRGPRPVIGTAPTQVPYGESFEIQTPNASDIESVVLIRLSSVTHSVNMDQRYVPLDFSRPSSTPDILLADAPPNPALAPPGYYMLFVLNPEEVPSTAKMVQLGGVPNETECVGAETPQPELFTVAKNRYITFGAPNACQVAAMRLTLVALPPPFDGLNGEILWIGEPHEICENSSQGADVPADNCGPAPGPGGRTFMAATLECEPYYTDWTRYETVNVYHEMIVPGGTYAIQAIKNGCGLAEDANYSAALSLTTTVWGDLVGDCTECPCSPPNGTVSVPFDCVALIYKFSNLPCAPKKARSDLQPGQVDFKIGIIEVMQCFNAFSGRPYPFAPGAEPCP